ncbi:PREDICTED: uncharacterized protein LOC104806281 [Tarenaya hassleriana]|uniref:uncharacterized protein LOC104806281 n=1 Tax=Tarenaya hassleriana TaxID=28532 RepID=UPI00053C1035|nr:PREDICTED: uncharacterized protein LOC104806281 [Tarenaya hassleriana]
MEGGASKTTAAAAGKKKRHRCRNICLCLTAAVALIIVVSVILGLTVFKPKRPVTVIDSVAVDQLRASVDMARMRVLLNLTLDVDLSLTNPNRVGFSYDPTSALLNYRGDLIGEAPIPAGRIPAEGRKPMNLTLTLMADRLLSNSQLLSDVISGELLLNTLVKVTGKVRIINLFNLRVRSSSSCDLTLSISARNVTRQVCKYSTKL